MTTSENSPLELTPPASSSVVRVNSEEFVIAGLDFAAARHAIAVLAAHSTREFTPGHPESLQTENLLDLLDHLRGFSAGFAALEARTLDALVESVRRDGDEEGHDQKTADGIASREMAMATKVAPASASHKVQSARRLVRDMPETLDALAFGVIDPEKAQSISRTAAPLDPALRQLVDQALGERMPELVDAGREQVCREVEALAQAVDPEGKERRHQRAKRDRGVTFRRKPHGMATLTITATALDATLARKRLSLEAERLRATGDRRGHSAIMADTATDALIGREDGIEPVTLDVGVIITDRALLDPGSPDPAVIEGYGAAPPEQMRSALREAMREPTSEQDDPFGPDGPAVRATLRRLYTHPTSGELVASESRSRTFPEGLSRMLRWSSVTCAGPHCDAQIRQNDHIKPNSQGGPTSLHNGNGLCQRCNSKEQQRLAATVDAASTRSGVHRVRWTSRYGSVAEVVPTPLDLSILLKPLTDPHFKDSQLTARARRGSSPPTRTSQSLSKQSRPSAQARRKKPARHEKVSPLPLTASRTARARRIIEPPRAESSRNEPGRAGLGRAGSSRAEALQPRPRQSQPRRPGLRRAALARTAASGSLVPPLPTSR